jgi:predicted DNA-binding transcriptional regulator YafY
MPANKYALLRYRVIDRCLNNKGKAYPSKEQLREACEEALYGSHGESISVSTIEKDLWAMRNEGELGFYAPIAYSKEHKGYYYEEEGYTIQNISLSEEEIESIRFAANTLLQFKGIPIFNQYEHAIEKIIDRLEISPQLSDANAISFVQFEQSEKQKGTEYLSPLLLAIKENKVVFFSYQKFGEDKETAYEVEPYLLKEYRNRWYLIARVAGKSAFRTFGLDRFESIRIAEQSFKSEQNFNPDIFFKHSIGISRIEDAPSLVIIKFENSEEPYLRTQPIHHSQEIKKFNDYFLVELFVMETYELYSLIMGFGNKAEVLEPKSMRQRIGVMLKEAASKY